MDEPTERLASLHSHTSAVDSDLECEISTRVMAGYFRYFEKLHGHDRLKEAVARIGGMPTLDYLLDSENFLSLEYCHRAVEILAAESGDPQFCRKAGAYQFTEPSMLGFAYYGLRALGSPKLYFSIVLRAAHLYNRVSRASIDELSAAHVKLRYHSHKREPTRLLCEGRLGQLEGVPTLWGLPPAKGRELECQVLGAPACVYELQWQPMPLPWVRAVLGACVGACFGSILGGLTPGLYFAGLSGLAALAHAFWAIASHRSNYVLDAAKGYTRSMDELRARFEQVQKLNLEMGAAQHALLSEMQRRERAEAALSEAKKFEALGRMAGGIAHDFNNVLTLIHLEAQMVHETAVQSPALAQGLDNISGAVERATRLVRQLLTFARCQAVEPSELVLDDHILEMRDMLARLLGESVQCEMACGCDGALVCIDPGQLEQLLLNLVVNARDAMPAGGQVRVTTRRVVLPEADASLVIDLRAGEYVLLSVSDTGIGMAPETLEHIFEPFFTTKPLGEGTGLGLATCHGIVKQAHGMIHAASVVDTGTTFTIYLPRVEHPRAS